MSKNISKIHLDILDNKRKELLQKITSFIEGFVLGGGTALALQLAHRKSFDFDFFSALEIPAGLLEKLSRILVIDNVSIDTSDELTLFTKNSIKITFLYYPFKPQFKILKIKQGPQLFSVQEIALQKAYTIGRRGEYRDYFDLYTILKRGYITIEQIIRYSQKVYAGAFSEKLFLEQLVYFGDISSFSVIPVSGKVLPQPEEVKQFFIDEVKKYL